MLGDVAMIELDDLLIVRSSSIKFCRIVRRDLT
jgi:hypothetical protein